LDQLFRCHIVSLNPKDFNAFNNRGTAYAKLKQFEKAIQDYNQAIELNPKDADAFIDRGVAYAKLKQFENISIPWLFGNYF
jgi:regulator of sirC expression with transglutaminase-like and TPR domain